MSRRLENLVALVTGGGRGIGEAIAKRFAEEGAHVIVSDLNGEYAQSVAREIVLNQGRAEGRTQDVSSEHAWGEIVDEIVATHGRLDILVNNAGILIGGNVEETTLQDWRKVQAVNMEGVFMGCRAAIAAMKERGGAIVNVSSIDGIVGEADGAAYGASKGGVRIFTKSVALHCCVKRYPVRVNSVHPGYIQTAMSQGILSDMPQEHADKVKNRLLREIPMNEFGTPVDVANACLFLASDEARYMTGSELVVDGGYTAN